jgi:hypothetical protein
MKSASLNRDTNRQEGGTVGNIGIPNVIKQQTYLRIFLLQVNAFVLSLGTNSQEADGWDPVCKFNPCTLLCLSQSHDHNFYWLIW